MWMIFGNVISYRMLPVSFWISYTTLYSKFLFLLVADEHYCILPMGKQRVVYISTYAVLSEVIFNIIIITYVNFKN